LIQSLQDAKDIEICASAVCEVIKRFLSHETAEMLQGCRAKKKNKSSLQSLFWTVEKIALKASQVLQADLEQAGAGFSPKTVCCTLN